MKLDLSYIRQNLILLCLLAFSGAEVSAADKNEIPKLSKEQAQEKALKLAPGKVLNWCLELDEGKLVYSFDIEGKDLHINEVEVDGNSGASEITGVEIEDGDDTGVKKTGNKNDLEKIKEAKLSKDEAQTRALKRVSGKVEKWELELEDKKLVYEFLISSKKGKYVVAVDSKSGSITEVSKFIDGSSI